MRPRTFVILAVAALVLILSPAAMWILAKLQLERFRREIESDFSSQMSLIEQKSCELENYKVDSSGEFEHREKAEIELRKVLSGVPEIHSADWGLDGHHGLHTLKSWPKTITSTTTCTLLHSTSADGLHSLYYGWTDTNQILLVYEGWIPKGKNRSYSIRFRPDAIEEKARSH
jgi:hypothetical protein